jgi:isopenicillin N synthase-like dioxygenase
VRLFEVVKHEIPKKMLEEILRAMHGFHELPKEVKTEFYSKDLMRKVRFSGNYNLGTSDFAEWRDTFLCAMSYETLDPQNCLRFAGIYAT